MQVRDSLSQSHHGALEGQGCLKGVGLSPAQMLILPLAMTSLPVKFSALTGWGKTSED